jgi:hypothetical protein
MLGDTYHEYELLAFSFFVATINISHSGLYDFLCNYALPSGSGTSTLSLTLWTTLGAKQLYDFAFIIGTDDLVQ